MEVIPKSKRILSPRAKLSKNPHFNKPIKATVHPSSKNVLSSYIVPEEKDEEGTSPQKIKRKSKKSSTVTTPFPLSFGSIRSSYKLEQNEACREYMEDYILSISGFNRKSSCYLFCVFDGHGGKETAELSTKIFPEILIKKIISKPFDIESCLQQSFLLLDKELEKNRTKYEDVGNTATAVYIDNKILYCANVGDSSCLLIEKNKATFITVNDDFSNKKEIQRIKESGAKIIDERLEGELAVTRSIGDFDLKDKGLISIPHTCKIILDSNSRYCILASDGVWDDLTPEDVLKICNENKDPDVIVNEIVRQALESGSEDNISCIVVQLN